MINGVTEFGASQNPQQLQAYLRGLEDMVRQLGSSAGADATTIPPPIQSAWTVISKDGVFIIDITAPQNIVRPTLAVSRKYATDLDIDTNQVAAQIFYQLQSATTVNFDATGNVQTYGGDSGDTKLHWEIRDPNQTKFWRIRSKYQSSDWAAWQIWQDPLFCGPVAVWSGLARTLSLTLLNSQAQTTDGSNALSQVGTTTAVAIASKTWNVGSGVQLTYASGSVDPGVYGTFYIYAIDLKKAGGVVTYLSTANAGDLASADGLIAFGFIHTSAGGGGAGGGGGSCHIAGTQIEMYDGSFKDCSLIVKGDRIMGTDGGVETAQYDAEAVANVPCFSLAFDNGVTVNGVSTTEPIMLAAGTFIKVFDAIVGQQFQTRSAIATLQTKTFLGNRTVYRQRLDMTKTFWADGLASHNMKQAGP